MEKKQRQTKQNAVRVEPSTMTSPTLAATLYVRAASEPPLATSQTTTLQLSPLLLDAQTANPQEKL